MTKWKKFDFLKFDGGCFSKCALPIPGATLKNEPSKFDLLREEKKQRFHGKSINKKDSLTLPVKLHFSERPCQDPLCHQQAQAISHPINNTLAKRLMGIRSNFSDGKLIEPLMLLNLKQLNTCLRRSNPSCGKLANRTWLLSLPKNSCGNSRHLFKLY